MNTLNLKSGVHHVLVQGQVQSRIKAVIKYKKFEHDLLKSFKLRVCINFDSLGEISCCQHSSFV